MALHCRCCLPPWPAARACGHACLLACAGRPCLARPAAGCLLPRSHADSSSSSPQRQQEQERRRRSGRSRCGSAPSRIATGRAGCWRCGVAAASFQSPRCSFSVAAAVPAPWMRHSRRCARPSFRRLLAPPWLPGSCRRRAGRHCTMRWPPLRSPATRCAFGCAPARAAPRTAWFTSMLSLCLLSSSRQLTNQRQRALRQRPPGSSWKQPRPWQPWRHRRTRGPRRQRRASRSPPRYSPPPRAQAGCRRARTARGTSGRG